VSTPIVRHPGEFRWETRLLSVMTLILTAMGIASCYAVSTYIGSWFNDATMQAIAALIGGVVFLVVARIDYRVWRKIALPAFLVTIAGLVLIGLVALHWRGARASGKLDAIFPLTNGAHRWIKIGPKVQVAEIARFTLTAWLAAYAAALGAKVRSFNEGFIPLMASIAVIVGLVAIEPSMTMAAALAVIGVTVIFTAGARVPHLALVALPAILAVVLVLKFDPVRSHRTGTFKGSALDCTVADQACEGLIGFGDGGLLGVGYGNGTQKLGHTPEAYSDYILSVIGEEWGFVGLAFIVLCYAIFCWMGFRIARTAPDPFGTYLASGLTISVGVTAFMHAAVVTWLMPATGLTLPFMSVGRVSLILYLLSAGVIVSIGRQRGRPVRAK
jgi:cell division protein FtsW